MFNGYLKYNKKTLYLCRKNNQMKIILTILSLMLSGMVTVAIAQIKAQTIEVRGRLVEQIAHQRKGVGNIEISVATKRPFKTNKEGNFTFVVDYNKSDHLNISILNQGYRIINPHGGVIELMGEQLLNKNPIIQIEILVVGDHTDPVLEEKFHQLERKMKSLKRQRQLSRKQINKLNEKLAQQILNSENERQQRQSEIDRIQEDLNNQTHQNKELQDSLKSLQNQNKKLNQRVDELTEDLFYALAEKYKSQQKYYREFAKELEDYLVKVKDLRDWLKHMDDYFLNPQAQEDFFHVVSEYEKTWLIINNKHASYEKAVDQEWDNKFALENLQNTFRYILDDIHKNTFLGTFNDNVYRTLQDWATKKTRKGKAEKLVAKGSPIALQDFNTKINQLEKMIEETLFQLRSNL